MKIVIAFNAFKESLSAPCACEAFARGLARALPEAEIVCVPMADGGDGTAEALVAAGGGRFRRIRAEGPLGNPVNGAYGEFDGGETAVIEMATFSGLRLLDPAWRNPMKTSTYGTGQAIQKALQRGARRVIVGVGGSATVDGGIGAAAALGCRFLDAKGRALRPCGGSLERLARIVPPESAPWDVAEILVACDVTNALLGPRGAARVFGPQKGATPAQVERLEAGLAHLADTAKRDLGVGIRRLRGGGAAGGLAAGLAVFCGARLLPGAALVAESAGLAEACEGADWVVTGEGRLDRQTLDGKAPAEVLRIGREAGARVIGVAGGIESHAALRRAGFDALLSICDGPITLDEAMRRTEALLAGLGESAGSLLRRS